jgi:hypothetical protein
MNPELLNQWRAADAAEREAQTAKRDYRKLIDEALTAESPLMGHVVEFTETTTTRKTITRKLVVESVTHFFGYYGNTQVASEPILSGRTPGGVMRQSCPVSKAKDLGPYNA